MGGSNRVFVVGFPVARSTGLIKATVTTPIIPGAPLVNETWWHKTGFDSATVVRIIPLMERENDYGVSFRTSAGTAGTLSRAEFFNFWQKEAPLVDCHEGEEWAQGSDYFTVAGVNTQARYVSVISDKGVSTTVDFKIFLQNFKKSPRTSAVDRLLGDGDF